MPLGLPRPLSMGMIISFPFSDSLISQHYQLILGMMKLLTVDKLLIFVSPVQYCSVSQTVVRGPQVVLRFCPCGPFRLNISPKKTEKIKLT